MRWDTRKLVERVRGIVTRGHLTRITKGRKHLLIHGQDWHDTDVQSVPLIQSGGVFYYPRPDSNIEYIALDPNADPSHRIAICLSAKEMPDAEEGDWIANPDSDNNIKINDSGICINSNGNELIQVLLEALAAVQPSNAAALTAARVKLNSMKC